MITQEESREARELYSLWMRIDVIAERLGIEEGLLPYHLWLRSNSQPRHYIEDEEEREATIGRLNGQIGKSYKERMFLSFLQGKITKDMYESIFDIF